MSEFASIQDAFGVISLTSQEPPILRGQIGEVNESRHKHMAATIAQSNPMPKAGSSGPGCLAGAGLCVGAGRAPTDLQRCSAGTTCPACAQCHPHVRMTSGAHLQSQWQSLSSADKVDIAWLLVKEVFESQLFIVGLILLLLFYIRS